MTDKDTPDGIIESAIDDDTRQTEGAADATTDSDTPPPSPS